MPDEFDASGSEVLTVAERAALVQRLKAAWDNLPADTQAELKPMLDDAHQQLGQYLATGSSPAHEMQQILTMKSHLTQDWDGHVETLRSLVSEATGHGPVPPVKGAIAPRAIEISVSADGEILGTGKYEKLDPRWVLVAGTVWLENLFRKHPFPPGTPAVQQVDNKLSIALVSDFGTGNFGAGDSPSTKIAKFIPSLTPDYCIHLGDVYYAGTSSEETNNLLNLWPRGAKGNFAMNSNHEMYSAGTPYFNQAVGGSIFNKLQSPWSFFALENDHWIIVGLDSAYFSDVKTLYLNGTLGKDNAQIPFLQSIAAKGKKVIVLTHHNPVPIDGVPGTPPSQLYTDVMNEFSGSAPVYWYFGHSHLGVAYQKQGETLFRCLGHGALPWGFSSSLNTARTAGTVDWFEDRSANDLANPLRVFNGFVFLELDGGKLTETFYDESGSVAWTKSN